MIERIVVLKCRRRRILELAHDRNGQIGVKKMRPSIGRFVWPGIGNDNIVEYVKSCDQCTMCNKSGTGKVAMIERPVVSEPFQTVAVDLVGPLPKVKRGVRYILMYFCMATWWLEAVALRTASTEEVAEGLVSIFCRMGIPHKVLSDCGLVFISAIRKRLYEILGVEAVTTTSYRPQGNGCVERLHGTLKPMLAKAVAEGVD